MYDDEDEEATANPLDSFWLEGDSLAPPCQAEMGVVNKILDLAAPYLNNSSDIIFDLGCGDGRICTEASKRFDCLSVGCEIEQRLIQKFRQNVEQLHLSDKVTVIQGDLCELDISNATVIVIYLLPESVLHIREKLLRALRDGCVIICNTWGLKGLQYVTKETCGYANSCDLFVYDRSSLSET